MSGRHQLTRFIRSGKPLIPVAGILLNIMTGTLIAAACGALWVLVLRPRITGAAAPQPALQIIEFAVIGLLAILFTFLTAGHVMAGRSGRMAVLARVVESTSAGVWILDNQLHTVWSNRAIDEILGTHPAPGTTPLPFLDDRGQETLRQHIRLRPRGLASSYHLEIHRPDGETRPVLVLGSPVMNEDGSWAGSFGIFIDFTQQLREQDRESRRDRLETLGAVVTRLNHKINNALMVIRGQAEIMLRRAGDAEAAKGPERIIEYVDIIYDEMQAISNLKDFEIEPYPGGHIMLRIPEADAASPEN